MRAFIKDLAGVSSSLVSERVEIQKALAAVADSVGTVKTFVQTNRKALVTDVEKLTRLMKTINSERDSIDTALDVAPVAINNLVLAYNTESGHHRLARSASRASSGTPTASCARSSSSPTCRKASKDLACTIFEQLLEPVDQQRARAPSRPSRRALDGRADAQPAAPDRAGRRGRRRPRLRYASDDDPTLAGLLGGAS